MKKAGRAISNNLCPHFELSRADLFNIVKIKKLTTFTEIMEAAGKDKDSLGCEVCKPTIGNLISSTAGINQHVMDPVHHANQETNDRFLANIQRDGTFSVVPRMAAGEVTADGLIAVGQVAKKYNLYTKITGGQRVDLFGAQKQDLPDIWEELVDAGFESGHAYGKSLRTVKSCVGSSFCRYGIGDSVGLAVQLEDRYKGIRSPHKIKGGVSGCVRECAEAQSKDFGLIATDKGWNVSRSSVPNWVEDDLELSMNIVDTYRSTSEVMVVPVPVMPSSSRRTFLPVKWSGSSIATSCSTSRPPTSSCVQLGGWRALTVGSKS